MAYSDYGGYAYRNGERIESRSDACFTSEGLKSTPGGWPGFVLPEGREGGSYHVVLGDGPIHVSLYKTSIGHIFNNGKQIVLVDLIEATYGKQAIREGDTGGRWIEQDYFMEHDIDAVVEVNGHKIELYWTETDNYYVFVRLTQPDGTVWTGFSGYGVGAGLEDAGYGYNTKDVASDMMDHWADKDKYNL